MCGFPKINLTPLRRMTDSFALIQHSILSKPDVGSGYTLDDNARGLIAVLKLNDLARSQEALGLAKKYSSFLSFAQMPNGWFHNHFSKKKKPLDSQGSPDSFGRALWACGSALNSGSASQKIKKQCHRILGNAWPRIRDLHDSRAIAFALLGCCELSETKAHGDRALKQAGVLSAKLVRMFDSNSSRKWQWFEPFLTYCNPRLPQALFSAYSVLGKKPLLKTAVSSFSFLEEQTVLGNTLVLIGQRGWLRKGGKRAHYDQQPVDAGAMVEAGIAAFKATDNSSYLGTALLSFEWFFGKNSSGLALYDAGTGACFDGLCEASVNLNQGAESVLAYLLARISAEMAFGGKR